jgi:hypothetical protein
MPAIKQPWSNTTTPIWRVIDGIALARAIGREYGAMVTRGMVNIIVIAWFANHVPRIGPSVLQSPLTSVISGMRTGIGAHPAGTARMAAQIQASYDYMRHPWLQRSRSARELFLCPHNIETRSEAPYVPATIHQGRRRRSSRLVIFIRMQRINVRTSRANGLVTLHAV